jgi:hypothetical protein
MRETKKYAKIIEIPVRRVKTNKKWIIWKILVNNVKHVKYLR